MRTPDRKFTFEEYQVTHFVRPDQEGMRLDSFVQEFFPAFSRVFVKKKILRGDVMIHGRPHPHRPSTKIHRGEKILIEVQRGNLEDEFWMGNKVELEKNPHIVYEDQNLVVISKPPYMTTHPSGRHLFYCATVVMEANCGQSVYSCHRLDRETSGVLVLAKNTKAANLVASSFESNLNQKCYLFIANKIKNPVFPFWAEERLGREEEDQDETLERLIVHCFPKDSQFGKAAQTRYEKVLENDHFILGLAFPKSGRQHQIRAHAAHHGLPLVGDKLYHGGIDMFLRFKDGIANDTDYQAMQMPRQALHALALHIPTLQGIEQPFFAPMPIDMRAWIESHFKVDPHLLEENLKKIVRNNLSVND